MPQSKDLVEKVKAFDSVCSLSAFFLRIYKAATVKGTLIQTNNFFESSDKEPPALRGHI